MGGEGVPSCVVRLLRSRTRRTTDLKWFHTLFVFINNPYQNSFLTSKAVKVRGIEPPSLENGAEVDSQKAAQPSELHVLFL